MNYAIFLVKVLQALTDSFNYVKPCAPFKSPQFICRRNIPAFYMSMINYMQQDKIFLFVCCPCAYGIKRKEKSAWQAILIVVPVICLSRPPLLIYSKQSNRCLISAKIYSSDPLICIALCSVLEQKPRNRTVFIWLTFMRLLTSRRNGFSSIEWLFIIFTATFPFRRTPCLTCLVSISNDVYRIDSIYIYIGILVVEIV